MRVEPRSAWTCFSGPQPRRAGDLDIFGTKNMLGSERGEARGHVFRPFLDDLRLFLHGFDMFRQSHLPSVARSYLILT